jgi:hypothetical protein
MKNLFRFFMIVALVCVAFSCGKDDEAQQPLPLAYLELSSQADATQYLQGDAGTKTFTVSTSRKFEAQSDANWCTVTSDVEAKTVTITVTRNEYVTGSKPAKRTGIVSVKALPEREDDDLSKVKTLEVNVEQSVYGLPVADMLDVVFNAIGAMDNSALKSDILTPNIAPATRLNPVYNRYSAVFEGNRIGGHAGDHFFQIPLYTTTVSWADLTANGVDRTKLPDPTLTALGNAFDHKDFSVEAIMSNKFINPDTGAPLYGEQEYVSIQQSAGWGLGFEGGNEADGGTFVFYHNWCDALLDLPKNRPTAQTDGNLRFGIRPTVTEGQPLVGAQPDVFYHVVVTTDFGAHKITAYVDGEKMAERIFNALTTTVTLPCLENKFANWIGLGADPNNPPTRDAGVVDLPKQRSQYSSNGELILTRIYGKALTAAEVELLYQYEKPAAK